MNISKDHVVQFHYTLKDAAGSVLESSEGEPMSYLHGHDNIIPGLEEAMAGKAEGDKFSVTVPPEKGYGEPREDAVQRMPLKHLQGAKTWKPGMVAVVETQEGPRQVRIVKVGRFNADVDVNHPFAGQTLSFEVEVVSVREATAEERSHGHAHGGDGHSH